MQPSFETTTGVYGRSFQQSVFLRPTNSVDVTTSYFLPGALGGDHAFKAGYRWRTAHSTSLNHRGGNTYARFTNGVANSAEMWRDGNSVVAPRHPCVLRAGHVDAQPAHAEPRPPLGPSGRRSARGRRAGAPVLPAAAAVDQLPGRRCGRGVERHLASSRHDLRPHGRRQHRLPGVVLDLLRSDGPRSAVEQSRRHRRGVRSLSLDRHQRRPLRPAERIQLRAVPRARRQLRSEQPDELRLAGRVDPDVKNDRTREFIVGFDRQLGRNMAVGGNYIWRKYDRFQWHDRRWLHQRGLARRHFKPPPVARQARAAKR